MLEVYAIIATKSQAKNCDNRFCDIRSYGAKGGMDLKDMEEALEAHNVPRKALAEYVGIEADKLSKIFGGVRQWRGQELVKAKEFFDRLESEGDSVVKPDLPAVDHDRDYMPVEILPSFAGMGGGGNGDGEIETGLVPRRLIVDELRAKPSDLLIIEARGDSMEPDFQHGDQILIDRRDVNPVQPGSFALWDGDAYVVKLVERVPQKPGYYRVFSANSRYSACEVEADVVKIMGRPVWFGRRL